MSKTTEGQRRGQLTTRIKKRSQELLGYEITQTELRLMAHLMYVMVNDHRFKPQSINHDDIMILDRWQRAGHITDAVTTNLRPVMTEYLGITLEFWNIICEIVRLGYVDLNPEEDE